ncbi:MAG: T9SS type A sorting domain-containing protein [Bacteroidetes bacterium]|jgi:hypothetical protein|nr:T9SS type A sorting domain-containing protein [Bacteroidota bacterium]
MKSKHYKLFLFLLLSFQFTLVYAGRIYVSQSNTTPPYDGQSWSTAFPKLTQALAIAEYGDSIWLAEGTYYPTAGTDRDASFELQPGVQIYGGFLGWEILFSQRNFLFNPTFLNGDIGIPEDDSDNSYHVLKAIDPDEHTILDGVYIQNGNADGSDFDRRFGGGLFVTTSDTASSDKKIILNDCLFSDCKAVFGGALAFNSPTGFGITPHITRSYFSYNEASSSGGAIYRSDDNGANDTVRIINTGFAYNTAPLSGGAVEWSNLSQVMIIQDGYFLLNECNPGGGALAFLFTTNKGELIIEDSWFDQNYSFEGGGLLFHSTPYGEDTVTLSITNSLFEENTGGGVSIEFNGDSWTNLNVNNCVFTGNERTQRGAGISIEKGENQKSNCRFNNCIFTRNFGSADLGGAIGIRGWSFVFNENYNTFTNCVFARNGGAASITSGQGYTISSFINCTFYENGGFDIGKNWSPDFNEAEGFFNRTYVHNCIFQQQGTSSMREHLLNGILEGVEDNLYEYIISHSVVSAPNCDMPGGEDACGQGMLYDAQAGLVNPEDGDYRLSSCALARDIGLDSVVQALNLTTDLAGGPRKLGAAVDMGAYEAMGIAMNLDSLFAPTCPGRFDGGFAVTTAGIPPYEYELTALDIGFVINADFNSLIAGDYQLVVTDSSLCKDTLLISVPEADSILIMSSITQATPDEGGSIEITDIQNGTPPFQYEWSNGDTASLIGDLSPGSYSLTLTDITGCQTVFDFTIDLSNGLHPFDSPVEIAVFPNPASSWLQLRASGLPETNQPLRFSLYNTLGQMVYNSPIQTTGGAIEARLQLPPLGRGSYFWKLQYEGRLLQRGKLLIVEE